MVPKKVKISQIKKPTVILIAVYGIFVLIFIDIAEAKLSLRNQSVPDSQKTSFTTPKPFMDLFYDFTGSTMPGYPKGKINASKALEKVMLDNQKMSSKDADLILLINSSMYIYDSQGKKQLELTLRASPHTGFFPMTAISHIGPALAYYAKVKEKGGKAWQTGLASMLKDIKAVRALNRVEENNWLSQLDTAAWASHEKAIHDMVDYACALSGHYISAVLKGKRFSPTYLDIDFFNSKTTSFPIPFNNVMVATFMLTAVEGIHDMYEAVGKIKIHWGTAKVIVRTLAGKNVTAGLTKSSNWYIPLLIALSDNTLPSDRILIAPYARVDSSLGHDRLPKATLKYYRDQVWGSIHNRSVIASAVLTQFPDINVRPSKALPGDPDVTAANDMLAFLRRLKYSLQEPTQMLSNTVGFWMVGEFNTYKGDVKKIRIPGLTTGFPRGIVAYPANNPEIP